MGLEEYLDPHLFTMHHEALADRVGELRATSDPARPGLAVWPEYVATLLVLAGRAREVSGCTTTEQALRRIVSRHPLAHAGVMARHRVLRLAPAVLTLLASEAHRIWVETFSAIARRLGLSAASAGELDLVDTGFGRLGTLVCYDGFHEAHTSREPGFVPCGPVLDALGAEVVAQPSANAWPWDAPSAFADPGEHQLRSEQWFSERMPRQLRDLCSVRYVVNPQLVGDVLDNHLEAPSVILERRGTEVVVLAAAADARAEDVVHARVGPRAAR